MQKYLRSQTEEGEEVSYGIDTKGAWLEIDDGELFRTAIYATLDCLQGLDRIKDLVEKSGITISAQFSAAIRMSHERIPA